MYQKAVNTVRFPDFVQQVEQELVRRLGRDKVYGSGGLRVYTTLDPKIQLGIEKASLNARIPPRTTLAAVISDPFNGDVLGMVGQKLRPGVTPPEWNNAAQGQRQIGSTIKPLLYTTALSTGKFNQLTERDDKPISFPCPSCKDGVYAPKDFEGEMTYRSMTLREALDRSLNLPTVRIADEVGLPTFFGKLRELDLPPNDGTGLAAALGAVETTPVKMAAAYAPFANGGLYHAPRYITRVTTARGEVLYDVANDVERPHRVWSPQVAYLGLDMIQGVVNDLGTREGGFSEPARIAGLAGGRQDRHQQRPQGPVVRRRQSVLRGSRLDRDSAGRRHGHQHLLGGLGTADLARHDGERPERQAGPHLRTAAAGHHRRAAAADRPAANRAGRPARPRFQGRGQHRHRSVAGTAPVQRSLAGRPRSFHHRHLRGQEHRAAGHRIHQSGRHRPAPRLHLAAQQLCPGQQRDPAARRVRRPRRRQGVQPARRQPARHAAQPKPARAIPPAHPASPPNTGG